MCGILGIMPAISTTPFQEALQLIAHRGPDGFGIWQSDEHQITLGHRRLAILDLSENGRQPMEYGQYVITYNGEIYNFLEIRDELKAKGYSFVSDTDTEVIIAAFHEWGEQCLLKFNGMWAFAIWNKEKRTLFLSRDRFGIKPLYYAFTGGYCVFASEMKALMPFLPERRVADNFDYLKTHLFDYEATDQCLIAGIKRFPAGHYAYLKPSETTVRPIRYWDTMQHLVQVPKRYEEQVEQFRELFTDACRICMRSDVPIGTALSGGLDSSAVAGTLFWLAEHYSHKRQRMATDWQHAFVATFPGTFLDERYYAQKVAEYLAIPITYLNIDAGRQISDMNEYLYLFEELYLTSPLPMMETYKAIRRHGITVSIDGHGADEMMSGYGHIILALMDCGCSISNFLDIIRTINGFSNLESEQIDKEEQTFWSGLRFVLSQIRHSPRRSLQELFSEEKPHEGKFGKFNAALYKIFHQTILPTLLRNYDRYSMASGVEIRMPFMDYRLVTYSFSLPWQSKVRNGYAKAIIRDAMLGRMPEEVRTRKSKIGFNTPIIDWMQGVWRESLLDIVHSTDFNTSSVIAPATVRQQILGVINNPKAKFLDGEQAWTALMPYLWERAFLKRAYPQIGK
ncbi:asparagine synthase (glutamine-hydrolyzing) [Rhodoflexus caldus]|uniref:asparagine synthase (glutamine-hydrolyzing) n=1 Tax=Rhodoflexus caldus TaxID=2891236 RepID=UPI0021D46B3B|nr:asparagine synthase (glutamine-hydrolyzing) [Rhodoflexus caldus]